MFADGHLLTQLIPIFLLLKIKRCFENLVTIDLDPAWIRIRGSRSRYNQSGSTSLIETRIQMKL